MQTLKFVLIACTLGLVALMSDGCTGSSIQSRPLVTACGVARTACALTATICEGVDAAPATSGSETP